VEYGYNGARALYEWLVHECTDVPYDCLAGHSRCEAEDNFGLGAPMSGLGGVDSAVRAAAAGQEYSDCGTTVTPDLFAGELDAMARLLHDMAGRLSRHALRTQDLQAAAKHAADELRALAGAMASDPSVRERGYHTHLIALHGGLIKALNLVDERR
jgi:hypothetical protein